ncbi:MAG: fibronectin type III domain-containing protein [Eubacterium sp.]|nr:fibronectin type III domain-containing protein [Eubacterium sp.]
MRKNWKKYMALCLSMSMVLAAAPNMIAAENSGSTVSGGAVSSGGAIEESPAPTATATPTPYIDMEANRLAAPTTVTARGGSKRVRLEWSAVSGANGYYIYYREASASEYTKAAIIANGTQTSYVKKSLAQNAQYYFYVVPFKVVQGVTVEGALSKAVSAKTASVAATSKTAKKYSTKAKFQKSAAYKKYTKMKSNMNYSKSFAIPGAKQTNVAGFGCQTMVPQGMCLAGSNFLITAYDAKGVDYSVIYVVSRASKSYLTTIVLPSKAKVGGIAYDGKNIWISKGKAVASFPASVVTDAVNSGSSYYELSAYNSVHTMNGTAAYMGYYNNVLWVGSFSQSSSTMYGYQVGKTTVPTLTQKYKMAVPSKTQGITFDKNGTMILTRSYRTNASKSGYISQMRTYMPSYVNVSADGTIKKNAALKVTTLPPMAEGVAIYNTYTYTLFSSAYYKSCKYPMDRVIAMKTNKLI